MINSYDYFSSSNILKGVVILLALTFVLSLATETSLKGNVLFDLDLNTEDYMGVLMHLAIIALIIERFVEIFTSVMRKPGRVELERALREAGEIIDKNKAIEAIDVYKAQTGVFAITISFVTGLIVASVGIHALAPLFDTTDLSPDQHNYFDAIDIILTAGLIAGGSKGINSLTSSLGAVFDSMKYQSRVSKDKAKNDIAKL